jgi:hypothetical protein
MNGICILSVAEKPSVAKELARILPRNCGAIRRQGTKFRISSNQYCDLARLQGTRVTIKFLILNIACSRILPLQ